MPKAKYRRVGEIITERWKYLDQDQLLRQQRAHMKGMASLTPPASDRVLLLMDLEVSGGVCPKCQQPWETVAVKVEHFGDFMYWKPVCRCYPLCPNCKVSLHMEWETAHDDEHMEVKCQCGWVVGRGASWSK